VVGASQCACTREGRRSVRMRLEMLLIGAICVESANRKVAPNRRHHDVAFAEIAIRPRWFTWGHHFMPDYAVAMAWRRRFEDRNLLTFDAPVLWTREGSGRAMQNCSC
jgi:hypothetical protein